MKEKKKLEEIFTTVYQKNLWGDNSSVSGPGSRLEQTIVIRERIIDLIKTYNIKTIVDAPCGDIFWMKDVLKSNIINIDFYTGIDIVEDLIQNNQKKYGTDKIGFIKSDLTQDIGPKADLIICRDCLLHLSYRNIYNIINNFKLSGANYLLVSTYTTHKNRNVLKFSVEGRAINLEESPFKIRNKLDLIIEDYHGQNDEYNDKSLILIKIGSVNMNLIYRRILINEMVFIPGFLISNLLRRLNRGIIRLIKRI